MGNVTVMGKVTSQPLFIGRFTREVRSLPAFHRSTWNAMVIPKITTATSSNLSHAVALNVLSVIGVDVPENLVEVNGYAMAILSSTAVKSELLSGRRSYLTSIR